MKLVNDDCLDYMQTMEDNSVDLTFTSPPYNMNLTLNSKNQYVQAKDKDHEFRNKYKNDADNMTMEEYYEFTKTVLDDLLRISNIVFYNIQFLTGNKRALFRIIGDYNEFLKEVIVWDKSWAAPAMNKGVLNSRHELILVFTKHNAIKRTFDKYNFSRGTLPNVWQVKKQTSKLKGHWAVFSEELCRLVVENFSDQGDVLFDPFMGSGTLGVIAKQTQRNFIGVERDKEYFDFAAERINNTQLGLF